MTDKITLSALSKAGAFTRRTAQQSMKTGKYPSPPGTPPRARKTKLLKKGILFAYEEKTKSVVIGPVLIQKNVSKGIPSLIERGGSGTRFVKKSGVMRKLNYRARPYMKPAYDANLPKLPGLFGKKS